MLGDCPICYEMLDEMNYVIVEECGDQFCNQCFNEIIFQDNPHCPLHSIIMKNVQQFDTNAKLITSSCDQY